MFRWPEVFSGVVENIAVEINFTEISINGEIAIEVIIRNKHP